MREYFKATKTVGNVQAKTSLSDESSKSKHTLQPEATMPKSTPKTEDAIQILQATSPMSNESSRVQENVMDEGKKFEMCEEQQPNLVKEVSTLANPKHLKENEASQEACKVEAPISGQPLKKQDAIDGSSSEELVVGFQRDRHEVKHYDFVFGDMKLMEPPRILGIHMKHQSYFSMEMVSFIQVQGGWIEKYFMDNTSLVEKGNGTTFMEPQFLSNTFVPCLSRFQRDFSWKPRTYITVILIPFPNLNSLSCEMICFNFKSFVLRINHIGYTCLFWLIGLMLKKKMLVDETNRDRSAYAYKRKFSFLYFYIISICFLYPYLFNSNPMLSSGLFCFLGLSCFDVGDASLDLRTNPSEGGRDDEDIPRQPQETQVTSRSPSEGSLDSHANTHTFQFFGQIQPLVGESGFEGLPGVEIATIICRWKAKT